MSTETAATQSPSGRRPFPLAALKGRSPLPAPWRWAGPVLAAGFGAGLALRRLAYSLGLKKSRRASIPVISLGNLTVGGTGKTPAAAYLAKGLLRRGLAKRPAILMRGYGARRPGEANDEARELLRELPHTPVLVNPNRFAAALKAAAQGCDLAILDDGFQHWQLRRNLDLVLVDATDPLGGEHLLPWGRLREHEAELRRADVLLLSHADLVTEESLRKLVERLGRLHQGMLICQSRHTPSKLRRLFVKAPFEPPAALMGKRVFAACGIAHPCSFFESLTRLGAMLTGTQAYPDHFLYGAESLREIGAAAREAGAEWVVITGKDAVKWEELEHAAAELPPVWALHVELEVTQGERELWERIERCRYEMQD